MCARDRECAPVTSPRLPEALLDPLAYPQQPERVELRETHISWVFLAGTQAYKVKKPVTLPFLDYGSLGRRRVLCSEEVRLNRPLAPSVYVGVVAVVARGRSGLAIAPSGAPGALEYAVQMRRYDEGATLAAALAERRATEDDLAAIGATLARFHRTADRPAVAGGMACLEPVVIETLTTITHAGTGVLEAERMAALRRHVNLALAALGPELDRRERAGLVRDGHGDLRAEHVLLEHGVELVDAVEFDPALRVADVAYDMAFLVMDVARSDETLARALVRGYAGAGGDPVSPRLLAFLVVLRALVRAKVDLLRAAQLSSAAAAERRERALELVALAERFAWRVRLPPVLCISGLAASGKSTLAAALGVAAGRPVIASDVVRKARAGIAPAQRAAANHYAPEASRAVYAELGRRAAEAVRRDGGAIVDATFRHQDDAAAFVGASEAAANAGWVVCRAPPAALLERARRRTALGCSASDADERVVAAQIARAAGSLALPSPPLAELDTLQPVDRLLQQLAELLDARLGDARAAP